MANKYLGIHERLESRLDKSGPCWLWTGGQNSNGRATISFNGKNQLVPRVVYQLYVGEIPPGMYVCHKCDVPLCANPEHLFIGTQYDNMRDCKAKGRAARPSEKITQCKSGHPFSNENTRWVERNGLMVRHCRICDRAGVRRAKHANPESKRIRDRRYRAKKRALAALDRHDGAGGGG